MPRLLLLYTSLFAWPQGWVVWDDDISKLCVYVCRDFENCVDFPILTSRHWYPSNQQVAVPGWQSVAVSLVRKLLHLPDFVWSFNWKVCKILNKRSERRRLAFWVLVNGHLLLCTKPKKDKRDKKVKATRDVLEVLRKHDYVHEKRSSKVRKRTDK